MSKRKTIDTFFKKKNVSNSEIRTPVAVETNVDTSMPDKPLTPPNVQEFNLKRQIVIQDHINKYVNSLSTNKMKSDELISKKVHINLKIQTIHTTMILIVIDFNLHGSNRPPHIKIPSYAPASRDVWQALEHMFTSHFLARTMQIHYQLATLKKRQLFHC